MSFTRLRINSCFTLHPPYIISHFIGPVIQCVPSLHASSPLPSIYPSVRSSSSPLLSDTIRDDDRAFVTYFLMENSPCLFPWFSGIFNREDLRSEENLGGRCTSISKKFWGKGKGFWVERLIVVFFFFFLKSFWNIFFKIVGFALFRSVLWNFYLRMLSHSRKILEGILISRKIGILRKVDYGVFFLNFWIFFFKIRRFFWNF